MDAHCDIQGKSSLSLRFLYDGDRIQSHNTPADLGMENGDSIMLWW
ncbi:12847_t:CDS:2 [Entrophospora sp. SA101]|nr:15298_t:CDS:2 [Entrophospora sp. SA101]CAJ0746221.1 19619_t:CDS:2 [Entrophospora sp. SA101]CAJ0752397.1 12847_t:CDS:2 [Entrophospora sp. SA101]CAJ0823029.1 8836_t:CDS:2 [Entrophospora sp. SA101]CAJ0828184.1 7044_t:CDS:2 [Entrophospora sp. SA101]